MLRAGGGRGIFKRATTGPAGGGAFSPVSLFAAGEKGGLYDVSDLSSMFQDAAGTTPAVVGQPVGRLEDQSGNGNHLTAAGTARPSLEQDGNGFYYLLFDGIDDTLATVGNMAVSGSDAVLWTGSDRDDGGVNWLAQYGIGSSIEGSFSQAAYGASTFETNVKESDTCIGTTTTAGDGLLLATSQFNVQSGGPASAANQLRLNGAPVVLTYSGTGIPSGNPLRSLPFFLGSQNGTFPFKGSIYSCIVRFAETTAEEIEDTEAWLNERMGAY